MKGKILIVDDEPDLLDLAKITLLAGGYEVLTAASGEQALNLIKGNKPDLILLDVVLPGVSGLDICRRLKRNSQTNDIKIILFTALGTEVDMMLEKKDKADGYLTKPFPNRDLLGLVEKLLGPSTKGAKQ